MPASKSTSKKTTTSKTAKTTASAKNLNLAMLNPHKLLKGIAFYPAEYILMLATSFMVLTALSFLGGDLLNYWLSDTPADGLIHMNILFVAAVLVINLPIHLVFYWRVRHFRGRLTQLSQRVANGALGLYLLLVAAVIIWLATLFVNEVFQIVFGGKDLESSVVTLLVTAQSILWFKYAILHFCRLRARLSRPKYYVLTSLVVGGLILLLALIFPASAGRASTQDSRVVQDLNAIETSINSYVTKNDNLPAGLDDLDDLDSSVANHINSYRYRPLSTGNGLYSYEICASFKALGGNGRDAGFGFSSHQKGEQCFTRTAGYNPFGGAQESQLEDTQQEDPALQDLLQDTGSQQDFYNYETAQ